MAGVIFCLVVVTADYSIVFGGIFLNSRYRHGHDLGQVSHAVSHRYTRHQLLVLRFDEHHGRVRQCMFDLVAQLGLLRLSSWSPCTHQGQSSPVCDIIGWPCLSTATFTDCRRKSTSHTSRSFAYITTNACFNTAWVIFSNNSLQRT